MPVIDRHLLSEWLKIFGLLLCATLGLLLMQAFYDDFRDLLEAGIGPGEALMYFAVLLPSHLSVVLPLALLLSLLYVLGKLHRQNEITALRGAGLGVLRLTRSLWVAGAALCGVALLLNARVVPWSVETSARLRERFEAGAAVRRGPDAPGTAGLVRAVACDHARAGRVWFINRFDRVSGVAHGVTVSVLDAQRRERARLMARTGTYDAAARAWTFHDGRELWFDLEKGELQRSESFATRSAPEFSEDPRLMLLIDRKPADLSFFELRRLIAYLAAEENPKVARYAVRYYGLLADVFGPLIILALAIPFSLSGVRVNPAVGVSKSIGLFFLYYLLTSGATLLGGRGWVDPLVAALAPHAGMAVLGGVLLWRMR